MTAEEIRSMTKNYAAKVEKACAESPSSEMMIASAIASLLSMTLFLGEIAAQLSELNKNLSTMGCTAIDIQHLLRLTTERIPNSESRRVRVG